MVIFLCPVYVIEYKNKIINLTFVYSQISKQNLNWFGGNSCKPVLIYEKNLSTTVI